MLTALCLISTLIVASTSLDVMNKCPQPTADNPVPGIYYYSNPLNCGSFFICFFGNPIQMPCAPGTRFNDALQTCVIQGSGFDICQEVVETTTASTTTTTTTTTPTTTTPTTTTTTPTTTTTTPTTTTTTPTTTTTTPTTTTTTPTTTTTTPTTTTTTPTTTTSTTTITTTAEPTTTPTTTTAEDTTTTTSTTTTPTPTTTTTEPTTTTPTTTTIPATTPFPGCSVPGATLIPHPTVCMRYYNCTDLSPRTNKLAQYEDECPYPQLFDSVLNACIRWDAANCGPNRVILTAPCDYLKLNSCIGSHCQPCEATYPSCVGVADGYHEHPLKLWSRYYINCYYNRTEFLTCLTLPSGLPGYFSPLKKTCVSIYEVPTSTGFGKAPSCDGKEAKLYSVPEKPIVYYSCPSAQVFYCKYRQVFSDAIQSCL